jgi:hypothetical protein
MMHDIAAQIAWRIHEGKLQIAVTYFAAKFVVNLFYIKLRQCMRLLHQVCLPNFVCRSSSANATNSSRAFSFLTPPPLEHLRNAAPLPIWQCSRMADQRIPFGPVMPVVGQQPDAGGVAPDHHAEAVVVDPVDPARRHPFSGGRGQGGIKPEGGGAWLSRFRRLARDFERYARTVVAFIRLPMIRIMMKRLVANPSS